MGLTRRMRNRGFIFSLDAFVAFTLITIVIGLLVFTISMPKPFYPSLKQAHQLAYDTLSVLATGTDAQGNPTYLEQILADGGPSLSKKDIMAQVVGGADAPYKPIIPIGYGYTLKTYDLAADTWTIVFDSTDPSNNICNATGRCGKTYTKLRASASTFTSIYTEVPVPGFSPFCYLSCNGYDISTNPNNAVHSPCITTPCGAPTSNFEKGNNSIQLIELVVYT